MARSTTELTRQLEATLDERVINLPAPDYDADDLLVVREPEQLRALGDDLRTRIVVLLREHAHSVTELADELGHAKGTIAHHVKVLEKAGLIRVVRTRKVRAMTEKFYGRTARLFLYQTEDPQEGLAIAANTLRLAANEVEHAPIATGFGLVRARLTKKDMRRLEKRLEKLLADFRAADAPGGHPYCFTSGVWSTEADEDA